MKKTLTKIALTAALVLTAVAAQAEDYRVNRGDTLSKIGRTFGVSYLDIMRANGMSHTNIYPGQILRIPTNYNRGNAYSNRPVVSTPSQHYNHQPVVNKYPKPKPFKKSPRLYTVKCGDTITGISNRFGVTTCALKSANNLTSSRIYNGQVLRIPRKPSGYSVAYF